MDVDYTTYERARDAGQSVEAAFDQSTISGKSWAFSIRMVRSVYSLSIAEAREVL